MTTDGDRFPWVKALLARRGNADIRAAVAGNANCPEALLERLAGDHDRCARNSSRQPGLPATDAGTFSR